MKIAVFGGSFNPIHLGHLVLADCVCRELKYDKIFFIPCFNPPHKEMADSADPLHRLEMVRLSVKNDAHFAAESYEIEKKGISYTWDTVCALEKKYQGQLTDKIGLIIGFDLASHFENWKNARQLAEKCQLILAVRKNEEGNVMSGNEQNKPVGDYKIKKDGFSEEDFKFPCIKIQNPNLEISSSEIRSRIKEGMAWRYLVSTDVFEYIKKWNLYGCKNC